MIWRHFQTFMWLRWRIRLNQLRRAGIGNTVALIILAPFVILVPLLLFAGTFLAGFFLMPQADPSVVVVLVWDGVVVLFLFVWTTGLLTELQRTEVLSLDKFLHLPVSLKSAFFVNYLSTLGNLTLVVFVPVMLGLALGSVFGQGPAMLVALVLVPAFFLMVTALTHQFQGWLASLMVNKRRRNTIVALVTIAFVLLVNLPNMLNWLRPWEGSRDKTQNQWQKEQDAVQRAWAEGKMDVDEYQKRLKQLQEDEKAQVKDRSEQVWHQVEQTAWLANVVLPIGWLPYGAWSAAEGIVWPGLLGALGMGLIGFASLRRSFRTTMRIYTGQLTSGKGKAASADPSAPARPVPAAEAKPALFFEKEIPWVSEQAAAIALASFRSLVRAPEAKLLLLTPLIMILVFGGAIFSSSSHVGPMYRPLLGFLAMGMVIFSTMGLLANQFGFDRAGFRIYVLCAAPRRDILLGKNLAYAPLWLTFAALAGVLLQVVHPMRLGDFLAMAPLGLSMYLIFCIVANFLSIVAPMPIASGSLRVKSPGLVPILLQMIALMSLPLILSPLLIPLITQIVLEWLEIVEGWPINLVLSVLECVGVIFLYRLVVTWEGKLLQSREMKVLKVVTTKAE